MKKLQKDYLERVYAGVLGKTIGVRHGSNDEGWSYEKINPEEVKILNKLDREEHIIYSPEKIMVSKPFYDYMQDVLAISYVQDFL